MPRNPDLERNFFSQRRENHAAARRTPEIAWNYPFASKTHLKENTALD